LLAENKSVTTMAPTAAPAINKKGSSRKASRLGTPQGALQASHREDREYTDSGKGPQPEPNAFRPVRLFSRRTPICPLVERTFLPAARRIQPCRAL
jgi:hypothetical protein